MKKIAIIISLLANAWVVNAANDVKDSIEMYIEQAENFGNQSDFDAAIAYYDKAFRLARDAGDALYMVYLSRLKGNTYVDLNNYDSAKIYLHRAIRQSRLCNCDTIKALAQLDLGWFYQLTGNSDSAYQYYQEGLKTYESLNDTLGMARGYSHLSIYYKYSGDFDKQLEYAMKSYMIYKKHGISKYYINSLIHLGNAYEKLKENDTAIACYEMVYRLSSENDLPAYASTALLNIAVIHFNYGRKLDRANEPEKARDEYKLSEKYLLRAIDFNKSVNNKKELARLYSNISIIYRYLGQLEKSVNAASESVRIATEINDPTKKLNSLNNLGMTYKLLERYDKAAACYLESLELAKKAKQKEMIKKASSNLMMLYEKLGRYKEALKYSKMSAAYNDSIFNEVKQREIEKHKTNFEILRLKDQNRIKELDKQRIRAERNVTVWVAVSLIVVLAGLLLYFRMRVRKNRIIAEQRIQKLEDEKKLMAAQAVLVGQEKERERIARELHDGIGVLLSTASIHFSSVESKTDKETQDMLNKANKLLKEASKEVRQISHNMMPGVLSKFGLKEAVEDMFEKVEDTGEAKVDLRLEMEDRRLPENTEIMVFRIIQEMLNNTLKHAKASKITFSLKKAGDKLQMEFADDGIGFDEDKIPKEKNLGLSGIRSRVEYLGGSVKLESRPGKGTRYFIDITLKENDG